MKAAECCGRLGDLRLERKRGSRRRQLAERLHLVAALKLSAELLKGERVGGVVLCARCGGSRRLLLLLMRGGRLLDELRGGGGVGRRCVQKVRVGRTADCGRKLRGLQLLLERGGVDVCRLRGARRFVSGAAICERGGEFRWLRAFMLQHADRLLLRGGGGLRRVQIAMQRGGRVARRRGRQRLLQRVAMLLLLSGGGCRCDRRLLQSLSVLLLLRSECGQIQIILAVDRRHLRQRSAVCRSRRLLLRLLLTGGIHMELQTGKSRLFTAHKTSLKILTSYRLGADSNGQNMRRRL